MNHILTRKQRSYQKHIEHMRTCVNRLLGVDREEENMMIVTNRDSYPERVAKYFERIQGIISKKIFEIKFDKEKNKTTVLACTGKTLEVKFLDNKTRGVNRSVFKNIGLSKRYKHPNYKPYMTDNPLEM